MNPITIPNISIPTIGIPTIGIPSVGFPSASGGGGLSWPAGMKEHIKAWYDPKKQGMTNYDVIEAYVEDFAVWDKNTGRYTGSITNKTINITEVSKANSICVYTLPKKQNIKLYITGLVTGQNIILGNADVPSAVGNIIVSENGLYDIDESQFNQYFGIGFGFTGSCNITITQLPTSILKDLSGNGNHAYLYGGKGKLNSGMGVYQQDFSKLIISRVDKKQDPFSFTVSGSGGTHLAYMQLGNWNNKAFKILANINAKNDYLHLRFRNNTDAVITSVALKNGENIIPAQNIEGATKAVFEYSLKEGETITITQIPDYPDQLCYDGKMYAVCYGFPILTDYTVMAERTWFEKEEYSAFISNSLGGLEDPSNGAFSVELKSLNSFTTISFGSMTSIGIPEKGITYQTKQSYNGNSINVGTKESNDILILGSRYFYKNNNTPGSTWTGCHGAIIIADRSFTEEEINWLKNNLFTIDIPTPAYDFDFSKYKDGSNLGDSITDKYGNVLELHNFAWKGMSGLGGYINFPTTGNPSAASWIYDNQSITFTEIINPIASQVYTWDKNLEEIPSTKVNIIGLSNYKGAFILYRYWNGNALIAREIYNDGEYILEKGESYNNESKLGINWSIAVMNYTGKCNIKVNILPIYPGALVFDGIDDYARLAKMTIKTVVLDFVNLELDKQVYDNRDKPNNHNYFSIYPQADTVAYEAGNSNGKTYINGELNTTIKTNDLLGVRCITCASNDLAKETEQYICRDSYLNNYYGKIALYRITGFTEVLTPDQVWKWYQKNKPKGGDK